VAVVRYTYTHKQYRERHKTNNTQNNTKKYIEHKKCIEQHKKYTEQQKNKEKCGPCPVFEINIVPGCWDDLRTFFGK
jgi:hypothetical protein